MKARTTFGEDYDCKYEWDCFCQAGGHGVVFSQHGAYGTAFFEAFPQHPKCFLRGEGTTIEEAEEECWKKYQKVLTCDHEMERRGRTDGYGYCKHCSYSARVFEPLTKCCKCGTPTAYASDNRHHHYCKKCSRTMPNKFKYDWMLHGRVPRKTKKKAKQGASMRLYGTRYGAVTMTANPISFKGEKGKLLCVSTRKLIKTCFDTAKRKTYKEEK